MRSATQPSCVSLRMRFFSQNFGTIKRILPGSSSPSHREGPGTEVEIGVLSPDIVKLSGENTACINEAIPIISNSNR